MDLISGSFRGEEQLATVRRARCVRLHDGKHKVRIYDYANLNVRMLSRECLISDVAGMRLSATRFFFRPAPFQGGLPMSFFRPIRSGSAITPVACEDHQGRCRHAAGEPVRARRPADPGSAEGAARQKCHRGFLYKRLDTLRETNGRFRVNVALQIAFDGFGSPEVVLLCAAPA